MGTENAKDWSPFNLYDFFGYLIPGLVFLVMICGYFVNDDLLASNRYQSFKQVYADFPALIGTIFIIAIVVSVYIIGHSISMISHISIDRIIIGTIVKYPYIRLLGIEEPLEQQREIAWPMHKWIFLTGLIFLFTAPIEHCSKILHTTNKFSFLLFVFLIAMRILFTILKSTFLRVRNWQINASSNWYRKTIGWQDDLLNSLIVRPIQRALHVDNGLDEDLQKTIKFRIEKIFGFKVSRCSSDVFWMPCLEILQNPVYGKMINNWLHLFGLMRNMGTAMFLAAFLFAAFPSRIKENGSLRVMYYACLFLGITFIFRYVMLYYTYYSKNVFRMFYSMTHNHQIIKNDGNNPA